MTPNTALEPTAAANLFTGDYLSRFSCQKSRGGESFQSAMKPGMQTVCLWILFTGLALPLRGQAGNGVAVSRGPIAKILYTMATDKSGIVGFTNWPNTTPVKMSFAGWEEHPALGHAAAFNLTNGESRSILIWEYIVQIREHGAKDWKTIHDDYPDTGQISHLSAGKLDKFFVTPPDSKPWRVCILYSRGTSTADYPGTYKGDYELISREISQ